MLKRMFKNYSTFQQVSRFKQKNPEINSIARSNDYIREILESSTLKSVSDWKNVRKELLGKQDSITEKNIDSLLLNYCILNRNYSRAKNYLEFLKSEGIKPTLGTIGKHFKLYNMLYYSDGVVSEEDQQDICKMYNNIRNEYKVLDSITLENIICGLSVTKYWKKCIELIEECKITTTPNNSAYNEVVSAAFRNNEDDLGWNIFNEMIENNRFPSITTYETILNGGIPMPKLEHLFETLDNHDLQFDKTIANKLISIARNTNISATLTNVSSRGICTNCKIKLAECQLNKQEFDILQSNFFKEVIVGRNVFNKTTPDEIKRFKSFIENMGSFDVVIDGLNTQYSQGTMQTPQSVSTILANVVSYFIRNGDKVLLLGRNHMASLPKKNWSYIKQNSTIFLTQDISHDDPFLLYCALRSGMNTKIVTRDLMRSHLYLLKDKLCKKLFRRWFAQNRLHLRTGKSTVIFDDRLNYIIAPQKCNGIWHIPYIHEKVDNPKSVKYKWICIHEDINK